MDNDILYHYFGGLIMLVSLFVFVVLLAIWVHNDLK